MELKFSYPVAVDLPKDSTECETRMANSTAGDESNYIWSRSNEITDQETKIFKINLLNWRDNVTGKQEAYSWKHARAMTKWNQTILKKKLKERVTEHMESC